MSAQLVFKNFSSRGSSYKVVSGGWVLYSEPNYQGKATYQFGGKLDKNSQWRGCDNSLHIISKSGSITVQFGIERFQNNWAPRKQWRCYLIFQRQKIDPNFQMSAWAMTLPMLRKKGTSRWINIARVAKVNSELDYTLSQPLTPLPTVQPQGAVF